MKSITIRQTCEQLGVSDDTIYRLIKRGDLDAFKLGTRTLVTVASIEALVARAPRLTEAA